MKELNKNELMKVEGGWRIPIIPFFAGVIAGGLVDELIRNGPKKCFDDFAKGWDSVANNSQPY